MFLRLRSAKPVPLEPFATKVHQLAHLVALAVDANVSVQTVSAYAEAYRRDVGNKYERPLPLRVYFEALSFAGISRSKSGPTGISRSQGPHG